MTFVNQLLGRSRFYPRYLVGEDGEVRGLGVKQAWKHTLTLPLTNWGTLGKLRSHVPSLKLHAFVHLPSLLP